MLDHPIKSTPIEFQEGKHPPLILTPKKLFSMVTVVNYLKRKNKKDEDFLVLELQGAVEMIKSAQSGKYYAHARHASITTTVNEATCKALIGQKFPGEIKKVECDPYSYQIPGTTETATLNHSYVYLAENANLEETVFHGEVA